MADPRFPCPTSPTGRRDAKCGFASSRVSIADPSFAVSFEVFLVEGLGLFI